MNNILTKESLLFSLLILGTPCVFAEEYYYIPEHLLEDPPIFCAMEIEDPQMPEANLQLVSMAENAVLDWKEKLVEATNNSEGWNFGFEQFSIEQQQEPFFDAYCTVNIYFERQPPEGQWEFSGYADSYLTFSEITIFYLEPVYEYTGKIVEIDGELWEESEIVGFQNVLASDIQSTLLHEIGHSLGLDHPKFESQDFIEDQSRKIIRPPSIMIDPYEYNIPGQIQYEITDYDIRSVVNLYGDDGINEFNIFGYLFDFIIIGIILAVLIYFVNRRSKKKDSDLIPLDD